ncbi:MAG: zinc-dependent metalloprotease [Bacteroidota bacterium]
MIKRVLVFTLLVGFLACNSTKNIAQKPVQPKVNPSPIKPVTAFTKNMEAFTGFFNFWWDANAGKIWLEIDRFDEEFLYVNSLPAGVGSNDIGLDRGQLGGEHVVKFVRSGPKVLLVQINTDYRAISDNLAEQKSVEQAFAQSVIWGFRVQAEEGKKIIVDASKFLMRDAHGVVKRLRDNQQGNYKLDLSRSAFFMERTRNFPKNTEFEATLTFTGEPKGKYIKEVVPSPEAVTVRMHHSLVELPDDKYEMRVLDPRCGYFGIDFLDYATPIDQPLKKRYINRHRLEKKDPTAPLSEAVEPIVYYLDPGAPEPVRSALLDGARWWNQAFEAAGYKDAFQVKILPEGADPMDVRYNLIQWVHRSTRGWSYGSSVSDPRTGEIIKGHVSLGSLRVRQDFLIAQGLLNPYKSGQAVSPLMKEMALARLRQLSAHEVGHTLGLTHNFAASTNNRSSVMDYPHPYIQLKVNGELDFSRAYDDKIGEWDKRTILYGYQDFPEETDEATALRQIIEDNIKMGLRFISDRDARPMGGAHPYAHLWDNGADAVEELNRMLAVRQHALDNFGEQNIAIHQPMSTLEEVLVPLYLSHRYQIEGVAKLIGGVDYNYALRGDGQKVVEMVDAATQNNAIEAILNTLSPETLALPERILALIPPKPFSYDRGRESFKTRTGLTFDPISAAESAAQASIRFLLHHERAARLVEQEARDNRMPGLGKVIDLLIAQTWTLPSGQSYQDEIQRMTAKLVLEHLLQLAVNDKAASQVRAIASMKIMELQQKIPALISPQDENQKAHAYYALMLIARYESNPNLIKATLPVKMPDGSPIGMGHRCGFDH